MRRSLELTPKPILPRTPARTFTTFQNSHKQSKQWPNCNQGQTTRKTLSTCFYRIRVRAHISEILFSSSSSQAPAGEPSLEAAGLDPAPLQAGASHHLFQGLGVALSPQHSASIHQPIHSLSPCLTCCCCPFSWGLLPGTGMIQSGPAKKHFRHLCASFAMVSPPTDAALLSAGNYRAKLFLAGPTFPFSTGLISEYENTYFCFTGKSPKKFEDG